MSCHFLFLLLFFCVHIVPEICNPTKSSRREDRGSHLQITLSYAATLLFSLLKGQQQQHPSRLPEAFTEMLKLLFLSLFSYPLFPFPLHFPFGSKSFHLIAGFDLSRESICILRYSQHIESSTATYIFPLFFGYTIPKYPSMIA